jgi:hypothetical protein
MGQHLRLRTLLATLICSVALLPDARAVISELHSSQIDYEDWLESYGYNPEREQIIAIDNWNRRELEGSWPETEYSYYEWLEIREYYEAGEDEEE